MKTLFQKILLLALFVVSSNFTAQAQYVTIPDANFRAFLQQSYPGCFNGQGLMDTTCAAIVTAIMMDCSNKSIANLEGVQYFDGLQRLDCDGNQLTSLPALPAALQYLDCYGNQLTSLPALPATLQYFYCEYNQLTSLPALPAALQILDCSANQLTSLPALPATLQNFYCFSNQLTSLPALPAALQSFYCDANQLTSLPALPATLQNLRCGYNQLTSLPALPAALQILDCSANQLTSLPALPAALQTLWCSDNQLTSLPALPAALQVLYCWNIQLICLPALPNTLIGLRCSSTITCLPNLPNGLTIYYFQNGVYTLVTLPLCTPNNTQGCLFSARIFGKAYQDINTNCTTDSTIDIAQKNIMIQARNTTTQEVYTTNSNANGDYELGLPAPATYEIKAIFQNNYWTTCAPQTVTLTQNTAQMQKDVYIQPVVSCADMEIDHQIQNFARPCSTAVYKVAYLNSGTIASTGTLAHITLPAELTLQSMTRPYTALGGGVFEVQLPAVPALERDTFSFSAGVSCAAVMNQMLCTEAEILPHTYCNTGTLGWDGSDITLSGHCIGQDSVRFIFTNTGSSPMSTSRSYWVIEDNVMLRNNNFQLGAGARDSITIAANPTRIYRMIADEAPNNPNGNTQETFLIWGCRGLNNQIHWGFVNQFGINNGAINPHN
ncbi:MAG: leucine-rich repeat protein, partial [Bacteroidota bacterium]